MIEWEPPPTFSASIGSARALSVFSRNVDFLQGRCDGPKQVFGGVMLKVLPDTWTVRWEGRIRHQEDSFRWAWWVYGDEVYARIKYDGNIILSKSYTPGYERDWTLDHGSVDISGYSFTVGTWYDVVVEVYESAAGGTQGLHVAMLREEAAISGWVTMDTFTATDGSLDTKLNKVRTDILALKDVADMPDPSMPTISFEGSIQGQWVEVYWPQDDDYKWGGGAVHPGSGATIAYAFQGQNGMGVRLYYTDDDGAWIDSAPPTGHRVLDITLSGDGLNEGTVDVSNAAAVGNFVRMKIAVNEVSGNPIFYIWYLGLRIDSTPTAVERWSFGRGLDYTDLNVLKTRLEDMKPGGDLQAGCRLTHWTNQAQKDVGAGGHRVALLRRHGWNYLHYRTDADQPRINYRAPGTTEWKSYSLDSEIGWHTLDLRTIKNLLVEGMWYNLDDIDAGQEWQDT